LKTQGRRGEVAVEPHSDVPDRFVVGMKISSLEDDGSRRELEVEEAWPHKGLLVLKFVGVDSISDAEELAGCELQVPQAERGSLEDGWSYVSDLTGCAVFDGDREVGTVSDVQVGAGEAPLLIVNCVDPVADLPDWVRALFAAQRRGLKRDYDELTRGERHISVRTIEVAHASMTLKKPAEIAGLVNTFVERLVGWRNDWVEVCCSCRCPAAGGVGVFGWGEGCRWYERQARRRWHAHDLGTAGSGQSGSAAHGSAGRQSVCGVRVRLDHQPGRERRAVCGVSGEVAADR